MIGDCIFRDDDHQRRLCCQRGRGLSREGHKFVDGDSASPHVMCLGFSLSTMPAEMHQPPSSGCWSRYKPTPACTPYNAVAPDLIIVFSMDIARGSWCSAGPMSWSCMLHRPSLLEGNDRHSCLLQHWAEASGPYLLEHGGEVQVVDFGSQTSEGPGGCTSIAHLLHDHNRLAIPSGHPKVACDTLLVEIWVIILKLANEACHRSAAALRP